MTDSDLKDVADRTKQIEQKISQYSRLITEMQSGKVPVELLADFPELAAAKKTNDKLKYRSEILLQSIKSVGGGGSVSGASSNGPAPSKQSKVCYEDDASLSLLRRLQKVFDVALRVAVPSVNVKPELVTSTKPQFGHFQCNNAMAIAQQLSKQGTKQSPRSVAELIVNALPANKIIAKTEIAGPGFINVFINDDVLSSVVSHVLLNGLQKPNHYQKRRAVVDFSSPNIAKQMHVGHLRSTIIGEAICRLLEYLDMDVLRLNHVGDWGTQFGMLIAHLQDRFPNYATKPPPVGDLQTFYKESKTRFDEDADFKARAYERVCALQNGEPEIVGAWKLICDLSRKDYGRIYDRLDISITERGESFYQSRMQAVVQEIKDKGLLKEEEGRHLMFPPGHDVPLTIIKSDGGFTYDTSDMATIKQRIQEEHGQWLIYVVDQGQRLHFEQIFACARAIGWYDADTTRVEHVAFGVVLGEDKKKFKTRSGDTVRLTDLLDEGIKRAHEKLVETGRDKDFDAKQLQETAEALAYGCIKYADLSQNRTQDYVFSFDRMLEDRGNTAAYLLYAYVRIRSIARKAGVSRAQLMDYVRATNALPFTTAAEAKLARVIARFPDVLTVVADSLQLHTLCEYLYDLSTTFTEFYNDCYIIEKNAQGEVVNIHKHRLALAEATADTMHQALHILGIRPIERM